MRLHPRPARGNGQPRRYEVEVGRGKAGFCRRRALTCDDEQQSNHLQVGFAVSSLCATGIRQDFRIGPSRIIRRRPLSLDYAIPRNCPIRLQFMRRARFLRTVSSRPSHSRLASCKVGCPTRRVTYASRPSNPGRTGTMSLCAVMYSGHGK
jgi:hypothetical protein